MAAARRYFTDERLVVTTLSKDALPAGVEKAPALASLAAAAARAAGVAGPVPVVAVPSRLPVVTMKLLFDAGSARDPKGKEGLAALAAAMLTDGGSRRMRIDEIREALYPIAGEFEAQVDKEHGDASPGVHQGQLGALRGRRPAAAHRPRVPRGGLPAGEGRRS